MAKKHKVNIYQSLETLNGQQKKCALRDNTNAYVKKGYKIGDKCLLVSDSYCPVKILSMRYVHNSGDGVMYFKIRVIDNSQIVEIDQTMIYKYMPKWVWWVKKQLNFMVI